MSKFGGPQTRVENDVAVVTAISATEATCRTRYGSELHVAWSANKPDPLPRVGETWYVEKYATPGGGSSPSCPRPGTAACRTA